MTDKPAIWDEFDVGYGKRNYVQIAEYDLEVLDDYSLPGAYEIYHSRYGVD